VLMSAIKRGGALLLLPVLPDGSRSLVPASWRTGQLVPRMIRHRGLNIAIPASYRLRVCSTQEGSWTLSSVAA
jgi:hypothetical protein